MPEVILEINPQVHLTDLGATWQGRCSEHHTRIINAWQNVWKERLDDFALMALDLPNNPGKNITHWYVLCSTRLIMRW